VVDRDYGCGLDPVLVMSRLVLLLGGPEKRTSKAGLRGACEMVIVGASAAGRSVTLIHVINRPLR
jgi:hypothetical protein